MKRISIFLFSLLIALGMTGIAYASPVVDGTSDWITEWGAGYYTEEDIDDTAPLGSPVDPGYGGQLFDAEYIGLYGDGSTLYFGLQTGFNLFTGVVNAYGVDYTAGDIALDLDGDGTYESAIVLDYNGGGLDLDLYTGVTWSDPDPYTDSAPFEAIGGSLFEDVTFALGWDGSSWVLEGSVALSGLGYDLGSVDNGDSIHWTMSCGNDEITHTVPEPGTIALLGMGLVGLIGAGARRKMKKKS